MGRLFQPREVPVLHTATTGIQTPVAVVQLVRSADSYGLPAQTTLANSFTGRRLFFEEVLQLRRPLVNRARPPQS